MKFLHTSDWHLGKGLSGHDLSHAQEAAIDAVIDAAIENEVDAFVIAGDVFDRAFPSVEDVRRFNRALTRIYQASIPVVCIAGNHDEGARLAAFHGLLDPLVTIVGENGQVGTAISFEDSYGTVVFYPLPYLNPNSARRDLAPEADDLLPRSHEAVVGEAMRRVKADLKRRRDAAPGTRAVVIAHAFVVRGSETPDQLATEQSESERDISIGGVPSVPTSLFRDVDYVALGHLHGPRTVSESEGRPMIRYSGSLLRYSLSETMHRKSATIVDIGPDGRCEIEEILIPQPAGMARLRGTLKELTSDLYSSHHNDFVELLLTDERLPDNYLALLSSKFARILKAVPDRDRSPLNPSGSSAGHATHKVTPMDTMRNYYAESRGTEMPESMQRILTNVLERARAAEEV